MIPIEWLNALVQERNGYRRLLREAGGLPQAAHRLAKAKCLTREHATTVPTRSEVRAAAREIAARIEGFGIPNLESLFASLEAEGALVL